MHDERYWLATNVKYFVKNNSVTVSDTKPGEIKSIERLDFIVFCRVILFVKFKVKRFSSPISPSNYEIWRWEFLHKIHPSLFFLRTDISVCFRSMWTLSWVASSPSKFHINLLVFKQEICMKSWNKFQLKFKDYKKKLKIIKKRL